MPKFLQQIKSYANTQTDFYPPPSSVPEPLGAPMAAQNGHPRVVPRRLFQDGDDAPERGGDEGREASVDPKLEAAMAKWNFDFKNGVPLEGDWVWEKVEDEEDKENAGEKENRKPNAWFEGVGAVYLF